jgi:hypothetical protein
VNVRAIAWAAAFAVAGVGGAIAFRATRSKGPPPPIVQPVKFNHARHVTEAPKLACITCHPGAETGVHAELPSFEKCLSCHMKPQSKELKDNVVRELALDPAPHVFTRVTYAPGHVRFSHRPHVSNAKIACAQCHGDVAHWTEPPAAATPGLIDMDSCLDCHRAKGARADCLACHK